MFGEWLRQRRNGLTRKEFARLVGCSVSTLRKIESGERRPSGQIAELMANCLDIPAAERSTFVQVARGELNVARLSSTLNLAAHPNIPTHQTNFPVLPTPLISRQREIDELIQLLGNPQYRLLSLVGAGGIGKTRLAIETASQIQDIFADGVYFVALAPVNSTRYIVPVIAEALGFTFESGHRTDPKTQLFAYLKEKKILLLADNLEHLLNEPGIELFAELLASAPQVKLLATSRESLGLQGEWVFDVRGLPIPDDLQIKGFGRDTSVELFVQRARRAHVGFNATPEDFPAILRICRLVDGTPLAIELAAAWARTLSCDEIAREIERGLDFLSVNTRDLPSRHRSMRAVFDHSWKLLAEDEQRVLLRLSVFRGGFQREALEQVTGASLSALSSLVTKSLVRRSGDHRYDLHELIRQFLIERFSEYPDAQTEIQAHHSTYYLDYFTRAGARLRRSAQHETLAELTAEMDNFRAAWDWALAHHEFELARQVSLTLWYLFELRAWFEEGELVFSNAASVAAAVGRNDIEHEMRAHSAYFGFRRGNTAPAYNALTLIAQRLPSSENTHARLYLGIVSREMGKTEEANKVLLECLERAREHNDNWTQSMAGQFLGIIALEAGEYDAAHRYLAEALTVAREMGDPMLTAHALSFLSLTIQILGETDAAEQHLQESLALTQKIGYRWGIGHALDGLGLLAQTKDPRKARDLFAASSNVYKEIGDLQSLARALSHQGFASLALEYLPNAQNYSPRRWFWRTNAITCHLCWTRWLASQAFMQSAAACSKRLNWH